MTTPHNQQNPQVPQQPSTQPQPTYPYPQDSYSRQRPDLPYEPPAYGAPVTVPLQMLPPPPKRPMPTWLIVLLSSVGGVIVLCCMCAGLASVASNQTTGTGGDTSSGSTGYATTSYSTPEPTDTPGPNAGWQTYSDVVQTDSQMLADDFDAMSTACSSDSVSDCRASLVTFDDDVKSFIDDLNHNPAPPCFTAVDGYLRSALKHYDTGAKDAIKGIDQQDTSLIDKGAKEMSAGAADSDKATNATNSASCDS